MQVSQQVTLLAAAADCTSVNVPASAVSDAASFLQDSESSSIESGSSSSDDSGSGSFVPPTNQNMDMDNPLNAATSYGVFSPGTTPHVKLSIGDLPERDRGTPEVMLPGS